MRSDTILVICPNCGEQRVACEDVSLVVSKDEQHAYCFLCGRCGEVVSRTCDQGVAAKLSAIGVRIDTVVRTSSRPPLTLLDAARFEQMLRDEDLVVRLLTGG